MAPQVKPYFLQYRIRNKRRELALRLHLARTGESMQEFCQRHFDPLLDRVLRQAMDDVSFVPDEQN